MTTSKDGALSRRTALSRAIGLFALAGAAAATANGMLAQTKTSQKAVGYQDKPNNGLQCAKCLQFAPPNSCKVVDGTISPGGWCKLFAPKGE